MIPCAFVEVSVEGVGCGRRLNFGNQLNHKLAAGHQLALLPCVKQSRAMFFGNQLSLFRGSRSTKISIMKSCPLPADMIEEQHALDDALYALHALKGCFIWRDEPAAA